MVQSFKINALEIYRFKHTVMGVYPSSMRFVMEATKFNAASSVG